MLFASSHKPKANLSFSEQLRAVKQKFYTPQELQPEAATFKLALSVLNLLIDRNPRMAQELLIVQRSLTTWYEHTKQESINRTREIFNLRENLVIRVKKEIGTVLEQIGYYLRSIVQEYNDQNIEIYYVKYLNALKKLDWNNSIINADQQAYLADAEVQTQSPLTIRGIHTQLSIDTSPETLDSPLRKCRELNIEKYLEAKEQNLDLLRKNDYYTQTLSSKEEENKKLKMEISKLLLDIDQFKGNQKKYGEEVRKLTKMLEQIRQDNETREAKEQMLRMSFGRAESQFDKLSNLKQQLHKELDSVEQHLEEAELNSQKQLQKDKQSYFANHFKVLEQVHQLPTVKKRGQQHEYELQEDEMYRMLFIQALSIEDEMISVLERNKFKKEAKRFSHNLIVKSDTF